MTYGIFILRSAQKGLALLPVELYEKVRDAIRELSQVPRPVGSKKLTARDGWRIRVNDYRVVYEIDDKEKTVTILAVKHRRDAYR